MKSEDNCLSEDVPQADEEDLELLYAKLAAEFEQELAFIDAQKGLKVPAEELLPQSSRGNVLIAEGGIGDNDEPTAEDFLKQGKLLEYTGRHKEAIQHFMYCLDNPEDLSAEQLTEALAALGRICEFHQLSDQAVLFKNAERLIYEQQLLLLDSLENAMNTPTPAPAKVEDNGHMNVETADIPGMTTSVPGMEISLPEMELSLPHVGPPPISSAHFDPNLLSLDAVDALPPRLAQQLQTAAQYARLGEMLLRAGDKRGAEAYIRKTIDSRRGVCGRFGVRTVRQITRTMLLAAEAEEEGRDEYEREVEVYRLGKPKTGKNSENAGKSEDNPDSIWDEDGHGTGSSNGNNGSSSSQSGSGSTGGSTLVSAAAYGGIEARMASLTAELQASLAAIQENERRRGRLVREVRAEEQREDKKKRVRGSLAKGDKRKEVGLGNKLKSRERNGKAGKGALSAGEDLGDEGYVWVDDDEDKEDTEVEGRERLSEHVLEDEHEVGREMEEDEDGDELRWSDIEDLEDTRFFTRAALLDAGIPYDNDYSGGSGSGSAATAGSSEGGVGGRKSSAFVEVVSRTDDGAVVRKEYKRGGPVSTKDMLGKIKKMEEGEDEESMEVFFYQKRQLVEMQRLLEARHERERVERQGKQASDGVVAGGDANATADALNTDILTGSDARDVSRSGGVAGGAADVDAETKRHAKHVRFDDDAAGLHSSTSIRGGDGVSDSVVEDNDMRAVRRDQLDATKTHNQNADAALRAFMGSRSSKDRPLSKNGVSIGICGSVFIAFMVSTAVVSALWLLLRQGGA